MATSPIDFSSIGGKPVQAAPIDFSSIGGKPVASGGKSAPTDDSFLHKAWKALNTPVGDLIGADGNTKRAILQAVGDKLGIDLSPENLAYQAQRTDSKHPAVQGIRTFLAGSANDAAGMAAGVTSPIGLGTAALGAAGEIPGAAGTTAKALSGLVGAGFAAKGTSDVVDAGMVNTPEAWQKRLQGGAMIAGGAAGATDATNAVKPSISRGLLLGRTPKEAYQSALKPSTTLSDAERGGLVQTGMENSIPVSKGGVEKLGSLIDDVNSKIKAVIATDPTRIVANKFQIASRLNDTVQRLGDQVAPTADLNAISDVGNDFLNTAPDQFTASRAQSMKQGTYRALGDKSYGELKGASIEAQKSLARGLKDEIATQFPEIKSLNAQDSKLLDLQPVLEQAVNRAGNHQLIGIGTPIATGAAKALTGSGKIAAVAGIMKLVLDNPAVKSRLAISLGKAGVAPSQILPRIGSYSAALAQASQPESSEHPGEPPNQ